MSRLKYQGKYTDVSTLQMLKVQRKIHIFLFLKQLNFNEVLSGREPHQEICKIRRFENWLSPKRRILQTS